MTYREMCPHPKHRPRHDQIEKIITQSETVAEAEKFLKRVAERGPLYRETELYKLVVDIGAGKVEYDVLRHIVRSGTWLEELRGVVQRLKAELGEPPSQRVVETASVRATRVQLKKLAEVFERSRA